LETDPARLTGRHTMDSVHWNAQSSRINGALIPMPLAGYFDSLRICLIDWIAEPPTAVFPWCPPPAPAKGELCPLNFAGEIFSDRLSRVGVTGNKVDQHLAMIQIQTHKLKA
jgi:hypothetical protein